MIAKRVSGSVPNQVVRIDMFMLSDRVRVCELLERWVERFLIMAAAKKVDDGRHLKLFDQTRICPSGKRTGFFIRRGSLKLSWRPF